MKPVQREMGALGLLLIRCGLRAPEVLGQHGEPVSAAPWKEKSSVLKELFFISLVGSSLLG